MAASATPSLTAAENLVISRAHPPAVIDWRKEKRDLAAFMERMPFHVPLNIPVSGLSAGYGKAEVLSGADLLTLEVDVLLPAALENVITTKNAKDIKARIICEGANGPTTAAADSILDENGIFVIPDILANAGGVTVSYFEWVQDRGGYFWPEDLVNERLETIMRRSFKDVLELSRQRRVNMRTAAYMVSISRVASVHKLRGIYA
jgi:glutamate dehydrogenase (NAD(P)+)